MFKGEKEKTGTRDSILRSESKRRSRGVGAGDAEEGVEAGGGGAGGGGAGGGESGGGAGKER